jgi:hypothetical protein
MVVWNEANNAKVCQLAQSTELRPKHHFFANRTSIGDLTLVEASLLTSHQLICQIIKTHNIDINFKALAESMGDSKLPFPLPYPTEKISTPNTLIESRCVLYPALPSISWVPRHNPCLLNRLSPTLRASPPYLAKIPPIRPTKTSSFSTRVC